MYNYKYNDIHFHNAGRKDMRKNTIGIFIGIVLISIAFIPFGNAMSIGNTLFIDDTAPLEVEVTWRA